MSKDQDIKAMDHKIRQLRATAEELKELGQGIEAVRRNVDRILASTRMLEINVSEVLQVL
jgi:hypothetical protein